MKKSTILLVLFSIICCAILWSASPMALLYSSQPPAGVSGSPSDGTTCAASGCHTGSAVQSATGWITSNIPSGGYIAGTTYTITATATYSGRSTFGFEISPQNTAGTILGTLINTSSQTTLIGGGNYIGQTFNGLSGSNSKTWTFNWKAPVAGTGSVTFYGAFNAANGTGGTGGDFIYTSTLTVSEIVPFANDASISNINYPKNTVCTSFLPQVTLVNKGTSTLTSATINYKLDNGANNTFSWAGNLVSNASTTVTLNNMSAGLGNHTFDANTTLPNGMADEKPSNNAATTVSFSVANPSTLPFNEGFEGITFVPSGWSLNTTNIDTTWARTTAAAKTGTASAFMDNADYNSRGTIDEMVFPSLDLTSKQSPSMTFEVSYKMWTNPTSTNPPPHTDTLEVLISTNCGQTYTIIYKKFGTNLAIGTPTFQNSNWTPAAATDWRKETINLSAYSTASAAIIKIRNINDWQNNLYIDDINIDGTTVNCNLTASIISSTNENCNGGNTGGLVAAGATGTTPYTYNLGTGTQSTGTFNNLTASAYTVTVTDAAGCTATTTTVITEPTTLTVSSGTPTNVLCNGGNNGVATVTATGGTASYTYNLGTGIQSVGAFNNLTAGAYTVTVTDAKSCTATTGFTITQPTGLVGSLSSQTNISCTSTSSGAATIAATGGTAAYNFNIGNGNQTTGNFTNLTAGTYTVTITDANACTTTTGFTLTTPPAVTASVSNTSMVSCNAGADGSITVSATGGSGSYSYNMGNGSQTSSTFSNLAAAIVSITVTDGNGCSTTTSTTVTQPTAIVASGTITSNYNGADISCNGASDGEVTISATGGTGAYTGTGIISNIGVGANSFTVTDAKGCSKNTSVTFVQPSVINVSGTTTAAACGSNNGSVSVTVSGGTGGKTYNWNNGAISQNISNVGAGSYTLVVSDVNSCTANYIGIVNNTGSLSAVVASTNISCATNTDGTASVTAVGGTVPYTYSWSPAPGSGQGTTSASNMSAGIYTINVTDNAGCISSKIITITEPAPVTATGVTSNAICGNTNGAINVTTTGGTAPYNYNWNNGSTTENLSNLANGTYTLTVTDSKGCTGNYFGSVAASGSLAMQINSNNVNCNGGADGSATVNINLGTAPYIYSWLPAPGSGQSTANASNMSVGVYTINVTDNAGCSSSKIITITEPTPITTTGVANDVICGNTNGSINTTITGGSAPYSYNWNNGATTKNLSNLTNGTYTLTVTDSKGCTGNYSGSVAASGSLAIQVNSNDAHCNGDVNGSAAVNISSGSAPFSYVWSPAPATGQGAVNATMGAGTYTVSVSDINGCSQTATFTIAEPSAIAIVGAVVNATCGKANGSVNTAVSGGSGNYTFTWNVGAFNTPVLNNVTAGNYTLEVIDNTGCMAYYSAQITNTDGATLSMATVDVSCFNQQDGIISTAITGGTSPYVYNWTNGAISAGVNSLDAGAYGVTVTDGNGCESIQNSIIITQPSAIAVIAVVTDVVSGSDGAINISVAGGVSPYLYDWNNDGTGDNNDPQNLTNLSIGTYQVIVIDSSGCTFSLSTNVGGYTAIEEQNKKAYFDVYPNPSRGEFNINFNNLTVKDLVVTIIDVNGQQVFLKQFNNTASSFSTTINIDKFSNGMYFVKITTGDKFVMKRIVKQ